MKPLSAAVAGFILCLVATAFTGHHLLAPVEDQLIFFSLRDTAKARCDLVMPSIQVTAADVTTKGHFFRQTVGRTDLQGRYFRATVPLGHATAFWEPGFVLWLVLLSWFSRTLLLVKLVNGMLVALGLYFLLKAVDTAQCSLPTPWLSVLTAAAPATIYFAQKAMAESLFFALLCLCLYLLRRNKYACLLGACLGLAALVKMQILIVFFPLLVVFWRAQGLKKLMLVCLGLCLVLLPWVARNYLIFDQMVLFPTKSAVTLWARNNPLFLYPDAGQGDALARLLRRRAEKNRAVFLFPQLSSHREPDRAREIRRAFLRYVMRDPLLFSAMVAKRISLLFEIPGLPPAGLAVSPLLFILFVYLGVQGYREDRLPYMHLLVLCFLLFSALVNADTRFRAPYEPLLILVALCYIWRKRSLGFRGAEQGQAGKIPGRVHEV